MNLSTDLVLMIEVRTVNVMFTLLSLRIIEILINQCLLPPSGLNQQGRVSAVTVH